MWSEVFKFALIVVALSATELLASLVGFRGIFYNMDMASARREGIVVTIETVDGVDTLRAVTVDVSAWTQCQIDRLSVGVNNPDREPIFSGNLVPEENGTYTFFVVADALPNSKLSLYCDKDSMQAEDMAIFVLLDGDGP